MAEVNSMFSKLWGRFIGYRLGHGSYMSTLEIPPAWNYERYLEVYGQVGWLFGVVSVIASSVADLSWGLTTTKGGKAEAVDKHPALDLLDYVNPFQTRYQFIELLQMYVRLVGEAFIVLNFNSRGIPAEMWLAPPQFMKIIPSKDQYISHYVYGRGGGQLRLEIPEVIHIMQPNPANPYRGLGTAQSIGVDLSSEIYASRYNQRVFYNDATPAMLIEYPELPPKPERKDIIDSWNKEFQGWRNARKTGFLWGGAKANTVTMTNKDMEYWRLRKVNADIILGAYHVPKSIMGMAEVGSRARAEADEYIFAKRVVKPDATRIKESLNEQLIPLFGDDTLAYTHEDPVPQNREALVIEGKELVSAGIITREEARELLGYDAEADGTFLVPINMIELPAAKAIIKEDAGEVCTRGLTEKGKEARWRKYIIRNTDYEAKFKKAFRAVWFAQQATVIANLAKGASPDAVMFDEGAEATAFDEKLHPVLTETFTAAALAAEAELTEDGKALVVAHLDLNAHTDEYRGDIPILETKADGVLSEAALQWLANESLRMAKMVNGTTYRQLRAVLAAEFEQGSSAPKIERTIRHFYRNGYEKRARLVARTEVIAASNEGALQTYEANHVDQSEFYAALDERLCDDCLDLHGRVFPTAEAHGLIPVHPDCRCTWVPAYV